MRIGKAKPAIIYLRATPLDRYRIGRGPLLHGLARPAAFPEDRNRHSLG